MTGVIGASKLQALWADRLHHLINTGSEVWDASSGGLLGDDQFGLTEPAELIAGLLLAVLSEGTDRWQEVVGDAVGLLTRTVKGAGAHDIAGQVVREDGEVWTVYDLDLLTDAIGHATCEHDCNRLVRALLDSDPSRHRLPALETSPLS